MAHFAPPDASIPGDIQVSAVRLYHRTLKLLEGPNANRGAAAKVLYGLCYFHPRPEFPLYILSELYLEGTGGVPQDMRARIGFLRWGERLQCGNCTFRLALAYQFGQGTEVNAIEAIRLFELVWSRRVQADDEWRSEAGMALADLLLQQNGANEDVINRVLQMYEELSQDRFNAVTGTIALGKLLRGSSRGSHEDLVRARMVYSRALNEKHSEEIYFLLARMVEYGEGGPMNLQQAYFYYMVADDHGVDGAAEKMEEVHEKINDA